MYSPMMSDLVNARMVDRRRAEARFVAGPRDSGHLLPRLSRRLRTLSTLAGVAAASALAVLVRTVS
jgi:hypothetical protein